MRAKAIMLVAGLWLAATSAGAQTAPSPPRLAVDTEIVDLGDVPRGQVVNATFVIRNTGGEPLRILGAKPG